MIRRFHRQLSEASEEKPVSGLPTTGGLSGESYSSCGCLGRSSFSAGRLPRNTFGRTVLLDVGIHDIDQVKLGGLNAPVCSYLVDAICAI